MNTDNLLEILRERLNDNNTNNRPNNRPNFRRMNRNRPEPDRLYLLMENIYHKVSEDSFKIDEIHRNLKAVQERMNTIEQRLNSLTNTTRRQSRDIVTTLNTPKRDRRNRGESEMEEELEL